MNQRPLTSFDSSETTYKSDLPTRSEILRRDYDLSSFHLTVSYGVKSLQNSPILFGWDFFILRNYLVGLQEVDCEINRTFKGLRRLKCLREKILIYSDCRNGLHFFLFNSFWSIPWGFLKQMISVKIIWNFKYMSKY